MSNPSTAVVPTITYDGQLTIATGGSRKETSWRNRDMLWSALVKQLSTTTRTRETLAEYDKMPKQQQDDIKDVGGFVGGTLKGGRRTATNLTWRQVVTLDADFAGPLFWDEFMLTYDCAAVVYSTHKHRPTKPRLRLCIPLSRPVTPDEYLAIARRIAGDLGIELFDDSTYQPHRLMYWPSTAADAEFVFHLQDAAWLNADDVLARYPDWRDQSFWPVSSRLAQDHKRQADKQGDPLTKPGIVGAFCRTYDVPGAITAFLSDVYTPAGDGRYTFIAGSTAGGLVLYDDGKFAFSHHGTDPASGRLVNAFDLVRLHRFGSKDEEAVAGTPTVKLPSYTAMVELAGGDESVKVVLGEERLAAAADEFGALGEDDDRSWLARLDVTAKGVTKPTRDNIVLILEHDPRLKGRLAFNEFRGQPVALEGLPWRPAIAEPDGVPWQDGDDAALRHYIESVYSIEAANKVGDALAIVFDRNRFHPVRRYLEGLWWDGLPRLDTLLIDYLGAEDSPYTRAVTRKALAAAVARVYHPGVKWDYMPVLVGKQGEGKSFLLSRLGMRWYSDSFTTVQGREAYEQLQGSWLLEMGELAAATKAEVEVIKHFISKAEDNYRVAYGRRVSRFPRQCVFFGTTNAPDFLRDKTGNRRFWPVEVDRARATKNLFKDLTQYEIDQIWAEAADAWRAGEPLFLGRELEAAAIVRQEQHTEESERAGMVREYLNRLLPADWDQRDTGSRRQWLKGADFGNEAIGTVLRDRVCVIEVWAELFDGDPKQLTRGQAAELHDILRTSPGWQPYRGTRGDDEAKLRFGPYGIQRGYVRVT